LPDDPKSRPHEYGEPVAAPPSGHSIATCSRCGQTRAEIPYPAGSRVVFRVQPDGRAFTTELPCLPIQKLLTLARNRAASRAEALSVATRAITMIDENGLVWHPVPPLLANALTLFSAARTDNDRRAGALAIARASTGSVLVTAIERDALSKRDTAPKPRGDLSRLLGDAFRLGKEIFAQVAPSIDLGDGRTMQDAGDQVRAAVESVRSEAERFRRAGDDLLGIRPAVSDAPATKRATRPAPVPKKATARRTKPRKARPAPTKTKAASKKKGSRTR